MVVDNAPRRAARWAAVFALCASPVFCAEPFIATGIHASAFSSQAVRVNWAPPSESASSLRVYRSETPIRDSSALTAENFLGELPADVREFVDRRAPPSAFYAVIALFGGMPFDIVVPSFNATVNPPASAAEPGAGAAAPSGAKTGAPEPRVFGNRPIPLPILAPPQTGLPQIPPSLPKESARDALALGSPPGKSRQAPEKLAPHIFDQEQILSKSGESFLLYDIISGPFKTGRYEDALNRLDEFLLVRRGSELSLRAEFYRGECEYFLGDYKTAVRCFLLTKTAFPGLSNRWIDAALQEIAISRQRGEGGD